MEQGDRALGAYTGANQGLGGPTVWFLAFLFSSTYFPVQTKAKHQERGGPDSPSLKLLNSDTERNLPSPLSISPELSQNAHSPYTLVPTTGAHNIQMQNKSKDKVASFDIIGKTDYQDRSVLELLTKFWRTRFGLDVLTVHTITSCSNIEIFLCAPQTPSPPHNQAKDRPVPGPGMRGCSPGPCSSSIAHLLSVVIG